MIDPKELRIGNWVRLGRPASKGEYLTSTIDWISAYGERNIGLLGNGLRNEPRHLEGIPLTMDILEKCGFVRHSNSNEFWNRWQLVENGWHISEWLQKHKVAGFEEKGVCYWSDHFIPVKYLHSLQNLYFCVVGKELEINF